MLRVVVLKQVKLRNQPIVLGTLTELRNNLSAVRDTMQSFPRQSSPFIVSFYIAPNNRFHAATSSTKIVGSCGSFSSFFLLSFPDGQCQSTCKLQCAHTWLQWRLLCHLLTAFTASALAATQPYLTLRRCRDSSSSSTHYDIAALHTSRNSSFLSKVSFLLHLFKTGGQKLYFLD